MTGFSYQTNLSGEFNLKTVEYTKFSSDAAEQVYNVLK